jgi:Ca-activated chloride channel family protein
MKHIKFWLWIFLILPTAASAFQWLDLWQTRDQQGSKLLQAGKPQAATQDFKDKNWQAVAHYLAGNYNESFKQFNANQTSDGQYNAGNAAAYMEKYQEALKAYDNAIALNPHNTDAINNREIIRKLLKQQQQKQQEQQQKQQQNQKQQKKNNSSTDKNKQNPNNPSEKNQPNQQNQQQNSQQSNANKPSQTNHSQQKEQTAATATQLRKDENNKQLLRRVADDPGSLLQQKFLRDYMQRHDGDNHSYQGDVNDF